MSSSVPTLVVVAFLLSCLTAAVSGQSPICTGLPDGYFVRDVNDCKGYYYCRGGLGSHNRCPVEFNFNELKQVCDFLDNMECHLCQQQTGVQLLPHPTNCSQFITCTDGVSYVGHCAEGYAFDSQMKICNPAARVGCVQ